MVRICLIQKELKDKNFKNGGEKVDFQILKALSESDFNLDVYCVKNNLSQRYKINNINELSEKNFFQNSISITSKLNYDLTFASDYFPVDIVYLHNHSIAYNDHIVKSKIEAILTAILDNKEYRRSQKELQRQKICINKNKIILTPSIILKNDLINMLHANGQNVYILPPAIDIPPKVDLNTKDTFTFGFIGNDFSNKGGFILLKALRKINDFNFKIKIIYPYAKIPKYMMLFIKHYKLEDKIEFLEYQEDMTEFYNSIDCLLLPSKKETFGLSVLEAMSRGKIAVVSSRCGAKDIIEHDNNGLVFDITKNSTQNLERILKYILINKNEFDSMRQKAIYTASVYNFEKFKEELIRIIGKHVETHSEEI